MLTLLETKRAIQALDTPAGTLHAALVELITPEGANHAEEIIRIYSAKIPDPAECIETFIRVLVAAAALAAKPGHEMPVIRYILQQLQTQYASAITAQMEDDTPEQTLARLCGLGVPL